jgi:hypothetical protein
MSESPAFKLQVVERPKLPSVRTAEPNPFTEAVAQFTKEGARIRQWRSLSKM